MLHIIKIYILILHRQILAITLRNRKREKTHEKDIGRPIFHKLLHVIYIGFYGSIVCPTPTVSKNRKWLVNAVTWSKYVWQAKIRGFILKIIC